MKTLSTLLLASTMSTALLLSHAHADPSPITEFTSEDEDRFAWTIVDDGVMGGLSQGKMSISDDGIFHFWGKLSLENNGGFSSVRTSEPLELDLANADGFSLRVKGDGRTYQLRLYTDARYRGMEVAFKADFSTTQGEWTQVCIPFNEFVGSFRGRLLPDQKFDPANIRGIGFLLADKEPGVFALKADSLATYNETDAETAKAH